MTNWLLLSLGVAKELGYTLNRLWNEATEEILLWSVYFGYLNEEQDRALKKAKGVDRKLAVTLEVPLDISPVRLLFCIKHSVVKGFPSTGRPNVFPCVWTLLRGSLPCRAELILFCSAVAKRKLLHAVVLYGFGLCGLEKNDGSVPKSSFSRQHDEAIVSFVYAYQRPSGRRVPARDPARRLERFRTRLVEHACLRVVIKKAHAAAQRAAAV